MARRAGRGRWRKRRRLFASSSGAELALATTADGLVEGPTTDLALLETALDRVRPGGGDAAAWPRLAGASAVHFITDGAAARTIDAAVTVHTVFEPADNVGITALEVRPSLTPGTAGDAYLEVGNYAAAAQKVRLRVTRGGVEALDRNFEMGPSEVMRQVIPVPQGGDAALQVHVEAPKNALEADDTAFAWVARSRPIAVTVVGDRTEWLREAFARDPGVRATFMAPANWTAEAAAARTDLVIFDRWAPIEMPAVPALLFAPPAATPWLTGGDTVAPGADERRPRWEVPGSHPVVQGVDPFTLTIEHARAYTRPSLVPVAQTAKGTPLVYVDESSGSRVVVVTFGVHESNLTSAPGFPVLLGNALEWLARPSFFATAPGATPPASVRPGLVTFTGTVQRVTGPDKAPVALTRVSDTVFAVLKQPGPVLRRSRTRARHLRRQRRGSAALQPDPHQRLRLDARPPRQRRQFGLGVVGLLRHRRLRARRRRMVDVAEEDYGLTPWPSLTPDSDLSLIPIRIQIRIPSAESRSDPDRRASRPRFAAIGIRD